MRAIRLALMVAALVSCSRADTESGAPQAVRTDSAGVTIAMNTGADRVLPWRFTRHLVIGGEESGPASFYRVRSVDTDAHGNLYVLDVSAHRVVVFDSSGAALRELGRKGGGPGEMQWPLHMAMLADGGVAVYDIGRRGLVAFDSAGAVQNAELPVPAEGSSVAALRHTGGSWYVLQQDHGMSAPLERSRLVHHAPSGDVELGRLEKPGPASIRFPSCGLDLALSPVFEPTLEWDARERRVVLSRGTAYVLDVHDGDRLTASYRRDIAPQPATPELAIRHLGKGIQVTYSRGKCTIDPAESVKRQGIAPVIPAIGRVRVSPEGQLWVRRGFVKGDPSVIDVLSPDGDYLGTLPAGSPMPETFLPNGDIVAIELNEETDVQRVVTYRVERGADGTQ